MWSHLLALFLPVLALLSLISGMEAVFLLAVLLVIPALDFAAGRVKRATPQCDEASLSYKITFHLPHIYQSIWLAMLIVAGHQAVAASTGQFVLIALCTGLMAAFVTVPAHEFMHRDCQHSRRAADIAFAMIGYGHYTVSHPIHHVKAGIERFGSAPAVGTSVWRHLPGSWLNGLSAAWRSEHRKNGWNPLRNRVLRQWLLTALVALAFYLAWGSRGLILFAAQAAFAVFFVEVAGYVQHYGLRRNENDPLTYDLAWDSDFWLSNRLLMNNPLHAHHHRDPMRVCMLLEPVAPTLPAGYFTLVWAALIPPLWFSIMDRRVAAVVSAHA